MGYGEGALLTREGLGRLKMEHFLQSANYWGHPALPSNKIIGGTYPVSPVGWVI